ncbi:retrotransposon hobase [Colletotrichum kahawae]|uniref:Retrotransposon hobase n=1 Tax=Colletotrichum kahawae TaxID=34407 RepID=A0AAD9YRG3_COLKA|nr:retrotransposon hobase [Colletotrichum kahawae]
MNAPVLLFTDSANAYSYVMNPLNQACTRYIDVRYKWIVEEVLTNKTFSLRLINGFEMTADGLTKSLKAQKHRDFVRILGLVDRLEDDMDQRIIR